MTLDRQSFAEQLANLRSLLNLVAHLHAESVFFANLKLFLI